MFPSIRCVASTTLSDISRQLQSNQVPDEHELRSRDGHLLTAKAGPTGCNLVGGRGLHRGRAVRMVTSALTRQLADAGADRQNAERVSADLIRRIRPAGPGQKDIPPLRVREVKQLAIDAELAAAVLASTRTALGDPSLATPSGKAGRRVVSELRLTIPSRSVDSKIIDASDFVQARAETGSSLAPGATAKLPVATAHWSIADTGEPDPRRLRIEAAIKAARAHLGDGADMREAESLVAALKACAAELTPIGPGDLSAPERSDLSLWILLAEGLCLEREDGPHLCTVEQLRTLSLTHRSSVLLALALEAKRTESAAPSRAARTYLMLSRLLEAFTEQDLMPPALGSAQQAFEKLAAPDFHQAALRWPGMSAAERQALVERLVQRHAQCFRYQEPKLRFANHHGAVVMLALAQRRMPVDTGDQLRWNNAKHMVQRLGQDLMAFWQFDLASRFERGLIDDEDVAMGRLMCAGHVPPLSSDHLVAHVGQRVAQHMDALAPTARQAALYAQMWRQQVSALPAAPSAEADRPG